MCGNARRAREPLRHPIGDAMTDALDPPGGPPAANCLDCGLPYERFPLDVILPRAQWLEIHPAEHGLLCAACIVERAAQVPGVTCVHAILEIHARRSPDGDGLG